MSRCCGAATDSSPLIDDVGAALLSSWSDPRRGITTSEITCATSRVTSTCWPVTPTTPAAGAPGRLVSRRGVRRPSRRPEELEALTAAPRPSCAGLGRRPQPSGCDEKCAEAAPGWSRMTAALTNPRSRRPPTPRCSSDRPGVTLVIDGERYRRNSRGHRLEVRPVDEHSLPGRAGRHHRSAVGPTAVPHAVGRQRWEDAARRT